MSRYSLTTRSPRRRAAPRRAGADAVRRADRSEQCADLELVIKGAAASPEQRVVVVEVRRPAGRCGLPPHHDALPLNLGPACSPIHPGSSTSSAATAWGALMEAATSYAGRTASPRRHRRAALLARRQPVHGRLGLAPVVMYDRPTTVLRSGSRRSARRGGRGQRTHEGARRAARYAGPGPETAPALPAGLTAASAPWVLRPGGRGSRSAARR